MTQFFQFESDFVDSLRCIPMQVRLKLDTCGLKLKLNHWNHLNQSDRAALVERPCTTPEEIQAYRTFLQDLVRERTGESIKDLSVEDNPAWMNPKTIPEAVRQKAAEFEVNLTGQHWANLSPIQRFALIKLSRSSHENSNFLPALKEFNLI